MAKISTYPILSTPTVNDILIGTDVDDLNITKNFSIGSIIGIVGNQFVPYTGATGNVNLGAFSITATSFIVPGGTASQFLKANGTLDSTVYVPATRTLTINSIAFDLSANRSWDLNTINSLTTTGTSGPATYVGKTLNIPQYQAQGNYITQLSGEATAVGPGNATVTLSNLAVISKILTGLNVTGGTVVDTDSILVAFGKVQNQLNGLTGGVTYQGTWNAATNTPFLQSSVGTKGYYYVVSVPGNTNLNGITNWQLGDWAIYNGTAWEKVDNTDAVVSVNGYTGAVVLTFSDVGAPPATRNLTINGVQFDLTADRSWTVGDVRTDQSYANPTWITSLAWSKITGTPTTLAGYGITDGALNTTELTINGVTFNLSANRTWNVGTVTSIATTGPLTGGTITGSGTIGITQSGVSSDGYLSSVDWNTFNNKQNALTNPVTGTGTIHTLPMWGGATSLIDSPLSYGSNNFNFQYNSATGGSVTFTNSGLTAYAYTIQMNNFGAPRSTFHSYTDGIVVQSIAGVQVSRIFANGNLILGAGTVDNGYKLEITGSLYVNTIANATVDTDKFIVSDGGVIKYRTGAEVLADIGAGVGSVTSVGLTMPSAFSVANSPITSAGTLAVTAAGSASQYIRGDGTLADFPEGGGGGSSVSYYLNSSVSQGTISGVAYRELSKVPILGAGTDINIATNGYIASYITDAGDPNLLEIPAGNWNFETYFSASSAGGSPTFYVELYKYDGTTFTLIASNSATPELISFGTNIQPYFSSIAVPQTTLALTDRLAVRYYVVHSGRTITLHTEDSHLGQIITTFTTGLTALNGLTTQVQFLATGTSGADFNIASSVATHTFNLPTASAVNRGALSSADWATFNGKQNAITLTTTGTSGVSTLVGSTLNIPNYTTNLTGYVPYTGATTNVDLGDFVLTSGGLNVDSLGGNGGALNLRQATSFSLWTGAPYTSIYATTGNNLIINFSNDNRTITLNGSLVSAASPRTFTFPDATGTIALVGGAGVGTVTSVSFSLGSTGTDLSASVANSTTTPAITLNVPTASASARGALSAADWTTFNSKQPAGNYVTLDTTQTITALKTILRSGDVLNFKIGTDTLYGLKIAYNQNELVPSGEATWSFVNTFNRDGTGYETTPISFFRGVLVTGERLLSVSINTNLLDYYTNNPSGRYPIYAYNTGVQQFASSIIVGETTGVVNVVTGAIADLPAGVVANFKGRVIGSNAVNSNEFITLSQATSTSRLAISLTTTGTSGPSTYNNTTGVFNIPEYAGTVNPSAREIQTYVATALQTTFTVTGGYTVGLVDVYINGVRLTSSDFTATNGTTVVLTVGTLVGNIVDIIKYTSGIVNSISGTGTTNELAYFTASTTIASLTTATYPSLTELSYVKGVTSSIQTQLNGKQAAGTYVTSVTASSPLYSSGGTTPNITIQQASGSQSGFLSSTDWTTFNNKQNALTNPVTGTGTSGQVAYFTGTSAIGSESNLFWDGSNDRLGIGANNPVKTLDVRGTLAISNSASSFWYMDRDDSDGRFKIVDDANNDRFNISTGGNVLINSTSDNGARLQVSGTATFTGAINATNGLFNSDFLANETSKVGISFASGYGQINSWGANTSTYGGLKFQLSASNGGTFNALTLFPSGEATFSSGITAASGAFSGGVTVSSASTTGVVVNSTSGASFRGYVIQNSGTSVAGMECDGNTGQIKIGGYQTTGDYFPVIYSDGVAALTFGLGATPSATFISLGTGTVTATGGTLSTVSDSSFKTDNGFIDSALEKVLNLKPRYFYWNEKSGLPMDIRQLGFYAQEVNEALGEEAANTPIDENTPWGIMDRSIIAMITKAVQELKAELDELKSKN